MRGDGGGSESEKGDVVLVGREEMGKGEGEGMGQGEGVEEGLQEGDVGERVWRDEDVVVGSQVLLVPELNERLEQVVTSSRHAASERCVRIDTGPRKGSQVDGQSAGLAGKVRKKRRAKGNAIDELFRRLV